MKIAMSIVPGVLLVLVLSQASLAKGIPDLVVIKSDDQSHSIEITDQETLKSFSPWTGQFIDWKKGVIAPPTQRVHKFEILFYRKWTGRHSIGDRGDLKLIYTVKYCQSVDGSPGYIYLPGEGEQSYFINIGTILRDGHDGKWHQADATWEKVIQRLLVTQNLSDKSK